MGVSAANPFYAGGTHRSSQCKENLKTPGPGAYKTQSCFPQSARDHSNYHRHSARRSPSYTAAGRHKMKACYHSDTEVIPIVNRIVRTHNKGAAGIGNMPERKIGRPRTNISLVPSASPSAYIAKGHSGDVPKGDGLPY